MERRNELIKDQLEDIILSKLQEGKPDGQVGGDFPALSATYRRLIRNGVPQRVSIRPNEPEVIEKKFETFQEKLEFLCSTGWMMDDPDVNLCSRLYKIPLHKRNAGIPFVPISKHRILCYTMNTPTKKQEEQT